MYFDELLSTDDDRRNLAQVRDGFATFLHDVVSWLLQVKKACETEAWKQQKLWHASVFQLTRHVAEMVDGAGVLVRAGCAEGMKPLLRSALEGYLAVGYILQTDSERRGLAYQVGHAHQEIKIHRRHDPTHTSGKQLLADLKGDSLSPATKLEPADLQAKVRVYERMLASSDYTAIEAEWQATKAGVRTRKKLKHDPYWYQLFDGPRSVRELAKAVNRLSLYENLYSFWSGTIHAGDAMCKIKPHAGGKAVVQPIRDPHQLQSLASIAASFAVATANTLAEKYLTDSPQQAELGRVYTEEIRARYRDIATRPAMNFACSNDTE